MTSVAQYGFQSYIINQLGVQRQQMTNLEQQVSTGLQSQDFGGLGQNRSLAIDFQSQIDQANTYLNTINNASTSVNILNTSIQGIGDTATSMRANFAQQDYTLLTNGLTQQQQTAANGLEEVVSTLNSNIGGDYVFGGKSTNAAPVTDLTTILDGTATQAGFNQVTSERLQADQGTANATTGQVLGRLQVTTPAANANAVDLTANGGVFGWQLSSVSNSNPTTGPALTQPAGGQGTLGVDFTNSTIGPGDKITINLTGPDGTAEPVVLTAANVPAIVPGATSPAPPGPGVFYLGSTPAATAANFSAALTSSLTTIGNTDLVAASAEAAGNDFFDTYQGAAPQRVQPGSGGPTDFANATTLVAGTTGPTGNTVAWYTGDQSATTPRQDATAQVDNEISINFGVRANEPGFSDIVKQLAVASTFNASSGTATAKASYLSLGTKVLNALAAPTTTNALTAIQTDIADAGAAANDAKTRLTTQVGTYQTVVSNIENADQTTTVASLAALQTQMQASYEASNILLHMSLATYITSTG